MREVETFERRNELQVDTRSISGWSQRTTSKKRSHRTSAKRNSKLATIHNCRVDDKWSLRKKEKVINGESELDGIELSIKGNGKLEILHVLPKVEELPEEREVTLQKEDERKISTKKALNLPVYTSQFSTNFHVLRNSDRDHRVPISSFPKQIPDRHEDDNLALLMKYIPGKEETAIKRELIKCTEEMIAMENDLKYIDRKIMLGSNTPIGYPMSNLAEDRTVWDVDYLMKNMNNSDRKLVWIRSFMRINESREDHSITDKYNWEQRRVLQRERGFCFHIMFEDSSTSERFAAQCGGLNKRGKNDKVFSDYNPQYFKMEKVYANAAAVRHFSILNGPEGSSFFISKDDGRAHYDMALPQKLQSRIGVDGILKLNAKAIVYLVTGPDQSYYAELDSGECLWGIAQPDEEFKNAMNSFSVHRVAFGIFSQHISASERETSWIVIGKDGRTAWKNIPSPLHRILSQRSPNLATPCEVSLGAEGSFFIRFADGEISYCLPPLVSEFCEQITTKGGAITSIALHPECPNSFIIRHTHTYLPSR